MLRNFAKRAEFLNNRFRWLFLSAPAPITNIKKVHLLVVKKPEYASIAKVAVESFTHFHPACEVEVHADEFTYKKLKQEMKLVSKRRRVSINPTFRSDNHPWQKQKVDLLLSLNGSMDAFMDADLRWNGAITEMNGVTFFVDEFNMLEKSPYRQMLQSLNLDLSRGISMKNTSFFTYQGISISQEQLNAIKSSFESYPSLLLQADIGTLDRNLIERLSEQFTFSVHSEFWGVQINYLKGSDGHMDGSFVESSYYGATGASF
jgi:hypothetical protein